MAISASHAIQNISDDIRKALGLDALLDPDSTEKPVFRRSNIPLRNLLVKETVPKLRKMAMQFSIPHFSVMEKPELCRSIAEQLLKPENMRQQFLSLTEDETAAFDHLIEMGGEWKPDDDRILDAYRNLRIMHYAFLFKDNTVMVPNEVAEAYRQILTPEFCEERQKIHWIENILYSILPPYYGYMPIEQFCRLCSRQENPTIQPDEVMPLYHKIQPEFNTSFLEDDWIADEELRDEKAFQNVQHQHADKPYARIPTKEIETLLKYGYPIHDPYYGKLKIYLLRETTVTADMADDLLHNLHLRIAYGADMDDVFSCLQDNGVMFSLKSLEGFLPLLQDVFNHTRTFANCGYSPSDIRELFHKTENRDTPRSIAPMSTVTANLLKSAELNLNRRGISVDLHSTSTPNPNNRNGKPNRKANKVYPNDPCPCGSGKKYKKCCGRLA